jgi:hypothetical protein
METTRWRKSSRSANSGDQNCVEARRVAGSFQVRDSKLSEGSPILELDADGFRSLLGAAR